MGLLRLFNVQGSKRLLLSRTSSQDFVLPDFTSGDLWTVEYQGLLGNGVVDATGWQVSPPSDYSLRIGIYASDGTQLAFQNTFSADNTNKIYTGTLSCNDAAFTSAVSALTPATDPISGWFVINCTDSSGNPVETYRAQVSLFKGLIAPGSATVAPGQVAATQDWVSSTFLRIAQTAPDGSIQADHIKTSPNGSRFILRVTNEGLVYCDPLQ
jgi:hypothetical protein